MVVGVGGWVVLARCWALRDQAGLGVMPGCGCGVLWLFEIWIVDASIARVVRRWIHLLVWVGVVMGCVGVVFCSVSLQ